MITTSPVDTTQPVPFTPDVPQLVVSERTVLGVPIRWAGFPRLDVAATPDGLWFQQHVPWPTAFYSQVFTLDTNDGARWTLTGDRAYGAGWHWALISPDHTAYVLPDVDSTDHALVHAGQVRAALCWSARPTSEVDR